MKRENGSFHDEDGLIPEGQSKCVFALEECYKLIQELSKYDDEEDNNEDSSSSSSSSSSRNDGSSDSSSSYEQDEVETQE
ncbi:hypothetical protein PS15m_009601 [Mucor circinelloides]